MLFRNRAEGGSSTGMQRGKCAASGLRFRGAPPAAFAAARIVLVDKRCGRMGRARDDLASG